jgi:hypothetical protein
VALQEAATSREVAAHATRQLDQMQSEMVARLRWGRYCQNCPATSSTVVSW